VSEDTVLRQAKRLGGVIVASSEWQLKKVALSRLAVSKIRPGKISHYTRWPSRRLQTIALPRSSRGSDRKSEGWQNIAARQLAKAVLANTEKHAVNVRVRAAQLFNEIARRAKVYCFVPCDEWRELTFDEEDEREALENMLPHQAYEDLLREQGQEP